MVRRWAITVVITALAALTLISIASAQTPSGRDRILVYNVATVDGQGAATPSSLTKLAALAAANNINLTVVDREEKLVVELAAQPDVAAVIYGGEPRDSHTLTALGEWIKTGGRALFMYDEGWTGQTVTLKQSFAVSMTAENLGVSPGPGFDYKKGMLPPWLREWNVGVGPDASDIFLSSYLVVPGRVGERGSVVSEGCHDAVLVFYSPLDGSVTWTPRPVRQATPGVRTLLSFFDDGNIDRRDNAKAALAMLRELVASNPVDSGGG
jgi:hypothetical protein